jgi:hypothetical protein
MRCTGQISADDRELIQQLLDDTGIVEAHFVGGLPTPQATRVTFVPILRRWIAEGLFFRAQKLLLPHQVRFLLTSNRADVKMCKAGVMEHWMGMLDFGGIGISTNRLAAKYRRPGKLDRQLPGPPTPHRAKEFFAADFLLVRTILHAD